MKLRSGCTEEYRRRHAAIWPELLRSLHGAGVSDYTIWLDSETGTLFGQRRIESPEQFRCLLEDPVFQRWQDFMADLLEQNSDGSGPIWRSLQEVFHMD